MDVKSLRGAAAGWRRWASALLAVAVLAPGALATLTGCGAERRPGRAAPAADAEWSWLQSAKRRLDGERARLAGLEAAARGSAPAAPGGALGALEEVERERREVERRAGELHRRLVEYINAHPPVQGEPLGERQLAALRMKSDEEIVLARAYVDKGGDYQRAIEIYEAALAVDPDNEALERELDRARRMRYMTPERFARVQEGMTPDQVRKLLGQPNLHNVREYADRGVTAWFYPKDTSGAAAAVWFHREGGAAAPTVYMVDYEAVETGAPEEEQAGG